MKNMIEYRGYTGSVEFTEEDDVFFGKVQGIRSVISYEGETAQELLNDFHGAVDDYLSFCAAEGKEPEKPYKGSFNIRISPELHRQLAMNAAEQQISLNSYIEKALQACVAETV